jgi:hypothetical protein
MGLRHESPSEEILTTEITSTKPKIIEKVGVAPIGGIAFQGATYNEEHFIDRIPFSCHIGAFRAYT